MNTKINNAELIARMLQDVAIRARKLNVDIMFIVDCGKHYDFDTTGTANWSSDAADVLTAFTDDLLHEDEFQIDLLLEKLEDDVPEL